MELKKAIYDDTNPPFADAMPAASAPAEEDLLMLDATSVQEEDKTAASLREPLVVAESIPGSSTSTTDEMEAIPTIPTEEEERQSSRKVATGVASGVFGLLIGGPLFALILGLGAAYAHDKDGAAGDVARSVGDLALVAKGKARQIDEKHNIVDKSKAAASEAWEKAQEMDRQHHVLERTRAFLVLCWVALADFVKRHNLVERGVDGVGKAVAYVANKIADQLSKRADEAEPFVPAAKETPQVRKS